MERNHVYKLCAGRTRSDGVASGEVGSRQMGLRSEAHSPAGPFLWLEALSLAPVGMRMPSG